MQRFDGGWCGWERNGVGAMAICYNRGVYGANSQEFSQATI